MRASHLPVAGVEGGIDYLTATWSPARDGEEFEGTLWELGLMRALKDIAAREGLATEPRSLLGYYGIAVPGAFVGGRNDGVMANMSGARAHELWERVARPWLRYTRVDVQITVRYRGLTTEGADEIIRAIPPPPRLKWTLLAGSGGATLYLGAPSSNRRLVVYNKSAEQEESLASGEGARVRYELRLRGDEADVVGRRLVDAGVGAAAPLVWWACRERGIELPIEARGWVPPPRRTDERSRRERTLMWLERQVMPSVRRLAIAEPDLVPELLRALSLDRPGDELS